MAATVLCQIKTAFLDLGEGLTVCFHLNFQTFLIKEQKIFRAFINALKSLPDNAFIATPFKACDQLNRYLLSKKRENNIK